MDKQYTYEEVEEIANYLKTQVKIKPQIGIICGSGLGSLGEIISNATIIEYKDIPNFPISTVIGHAGRLIFGTIGQVETMCMQGRFHYYEGNSLSRCSMPARLMKLLGATTLIVSNAAGSINSSYKAGDIMIIKDHINFIGFSGHNPLRGPNEEKFGPRFVAMNEAYNPRLIEHAKALARRLGLQGFHEGIYACVGGPNYETVAELRLMKALGADAVGMSTVHEIITARHCGLDCFAFSLITNEGVLDYGSGRKPDSEEIVDVAKRRKKDLKVFIEDFVKIAVTEQNCNLFN